MGARKVRKHQTHQTYDAVYICAHRSHILLLFDALYVEAVVRLQPLWLTSSSKYFVTLDDGSKLKLTSAPHILLEYSSNPMIPSIGVVFTDPSLNGKISENIRDWFWSSVHRAYNVAKGQSVQPEVFLFPSQYAHFIRGKHQS